MQKSLSSVVIYVAISSIFSPGAFAQSVLLPIIITPTRFAQPIDQVIVPTRIITHQEIKATVAGVLRFYSGFDVKQTGGLTSVFVQGTNSGMVKVLLNGVPINNPNDGSTPWSQIPVRDIEQINIIMASLSTLWGADAIGGVINIITRQPVGNGGSINIGADNNDTREGVISLHGGYGKTHAGIFLNGKRSAGIPLIAGLRMPALFYDRTLSAWGNTTVRKLTLRANLWQSRGQQQYVSGGYGSPFKLSDKDYCRISCDSIEQRVWRLSLARGVMKQLYPHLGA